mmetsp:Transcript_91807/g.233484  ORF Transcript_91807/g.233484 Transcript_91807/m.233484 type:complete len:217 (+) Transcript_91807:736-1386(+)
MTPQPAAWGGQPAHTGQRSATDFCPSLQASGSPKKSRTEDCWMASMQVVCNPSTTHSLAHMFVVVVTVDVDVTVEVDVTETVVDVVCVEVLVVDVHVRVLDVRVVDVCVEDVLVDDVFSVVVVVVVLVDVEVRVEVSVEVRRIEVVGASVLVDLSVEVDVEVDTAASALFLVLVDVGSAASSLLKALDWPTPEQARWKRLQHQAFFASDQSVTQIT